MSLLESLLDAIARLQGDALVMHVGEKPYVVTTSASMNEFRGPLAWGQVELSSRVLTPDAVLGMLGQILPADQRQALDELGAIEYDIAPPAGMSDRFTVVAARGGDDIWLEVRRHVPAAQPIVAEEPAAAPAEETTPPVRAAEQEPAAEPLEEAAVASGAAAEMPAATTATEPPVEEAPQPAAHDVSHEVAGAAPASDQESPQPAISDVNAERPAAAEMPVETFAVAGPAMQEAATPSPLAASPDDTGDLEVVLEDAQASPTHAEVDELFASSAGVQLGDSNADHEISVTADGRHATAFEDMDEAVSIELSAIASDTLVAEPAEVAGEALQPAESDEEAPAVAASEPAYTSAASEDPAYTSQEPGYASAAPEEAPPPAEPQAIAAEPEPVVPQQEVMTGAGSEDPAYTENAAHPDGGSEDPAYTEDATPAGARPAARDEPRPPAVVVPMVRRIVVQEPPPGSGAPGEISADVILRTAAARGAATIYIVADAVPMLRTDGEIVPLDSERLSIGDVERLTLELGSVDAQVGGEWMRDVADIGRVRCLAFHDHRGPGLILRLVPPQAISADRLGLPPEVQALCGESDGLVLVTGTHASGKTILMNAFVDLINRTRSDHVVTIESEIAFVHESRRSFISQREVHGDAQAVVDAIRSALREDPDVLLIDDLRSYEIASAALEAADSGRLVIGTFAAPSTVAAIEGLVDLFPAERRAEAQTSLAIDMRGVVAQMLVRRVRGGRTAAREVLLNTPAVAALIHDGKTQQLPHAIESGRRHGMMPLNDSLAAMVRDGTVHVTEAYRKAFDKESLLAALGRDGVDTSFAERLA